MSTVEADELREAQARGIEQLHDRAVAGRERIAGRNLEQPRHLIRVERVSGSLRAAFGARTSIAGLRLIAATLGSSQRSSSPRAPAWQLSRSRKLKKLRTADSRR